MAVQIILQSESQMTYQPKKWLQFNKITTASVHPILKTMSTHENSTHGTDLLHKKNLQQTTKIPQRQGRIQHSKMHATLSSCSYMDQVAKI